MHGGPKGRLVIVHLARIQGASCSGNGERRLCPEAGHKVECRRFELLSRDDPVSQADPMSVSGRGVVRG